MLQGRGFQRFVSEPSEGTGVVLAEFVALCQRVASESLTGVAVALAAKLFAVVRVERGPFSAARAFSLCSSCGVVEGWHKK
jgi:hypothetical protein